MKRLVLILLVSPGIAFAQETDSSPNRKVLYQKATEIDFTAVDINAALAGPGISSTLEHLRPTFVAMIRVRKDFNPELEASVHDVK